MDSTLYEHSTFGAGERVAERRYHEAFGNVTEEIARPRREEPPCLIEKCFILFYPVI